MAQAQAARLGAEEVAAALTMALAEMEALEMTGTQAMVQEAVAEELPVLVEIRELAERTVAVADRAKPPLLAMVRKASSSSRT